MSYFPRKRHRRHSRPARRIELVGGPGDGLVLTIPGGFASFRLGLPAGPGEPPGRWVVYRATWRMTARGHEAFKAVGATQ
jgi:hypothetical protein